MTGLVHAALAATIGGRWDDLYLTCTDILAHEGARDLLCRIGASLTPEDLASFQSIARDAAGFVRSDADDLETETTMFSASYVTEDGLPLTPAEISRIEGCIVETTGEEDDIVILPTTYAARDLDAIAMDQLAEIAFDAHAAWHENRNLDDDLLPWSSYEARLGAIDAPSTPVGMLLGWATRPGQDDDDGAYLDMIPHPDILDAFREMVRTAVPRMVAIDFPACLGRSLPDGMLRTIVAETTHPAIVLAAQDRGRTISVDGDDDLRIDVLEADGAIVDSFHADVAAIGMTSLEVAEFVRENLGVLSAGYVNADPSFGMLAN